MRANLCKWLKKCRRTSLNIDPFIMFLSFISKHVLIVIQKFMTFICSLTIIEKNQIYLSPLFGDILSNYQINWQSNESKCIKQHIWNRTIMLTLFKHIMLISSWSVMDRVVNNIFDIILFCFLTQIIWFQAKANSKKCIELLKCIIFIEFNLFNDYNIWWQNVTGLVRTLKKIYILLPCTASDLIGQFKNLQLSFFFTTFW